MVIRKIYNNKGWIRILEAFIAVTILAGFFTFVYVSNVRNESQINEIYNLQKVILDEIADNIELRNKVLDNNLDDVKNFVEERVPPSFNFEVKICNIEDICQLSFYVEEVFSSERIISTTLNRQNVNPKKVKIFMWRK